MTASIAEPSNLIPYLASDTASASVSGLVFNGLVKYDENLRLVGDLAESWEVSEDRLRITFHLKRGVRWQDGKPFSARDVVFTYESLRDPATASPYAPQFEKVASCRAVDDFTVEVSYLEPFSPGLASWGIGIVPEHLLKQGSAESFARKPVGTGPFRLREWASGRAVILEANPSYFEGRPRLERYAIRVIPDSTVSFWELQSGHLDLLPLSPLQFSRQTNGVRFLKEFQRFRYPSFAYTYLGYNLQTPLFSDNKVRQAIGLLINRNKLVETILMGLGQPSTGPYLPGSWAADPDLPAAPFDPQAARRLLEEAGWADRDGDGFLDKDGKKFEFTILTNQGNDERQKTCEWIQSDLRKAGIDMKIRVLEWTVLLKEFIGKRNFEAVCLGWQTARDPDLYEIFHSSSRRAGGFNFTGYDSPEVDRLLEEGRTEFDPAKRAVIYHRIHRLIREDEPYTFLYVPDALVAVDRRFQGVRLAKTGIGDNLNEWFVEPARQRYQFEASR